MRDGGGGRPGCHARAQGRAHFVLSRIRDEAPLPRRRRDQRSLREPGPGKRSLWSREAGERAARRSVDDVAADDSSQDREIRQSRRVAGHRIGSEQSNVCFIAGLEGAQLVLAECRVSRVVGIPAQRF